MVIFIILAFRFFIMMLNSSHDDEMILNLIGFIISLIAVMNYV